jgi:hypothetical protein
MVNVKFGKWEFTEEELDRQFAEATELGEEAECREPRAEEAHYDGELGHLVIKLVDGTIISIPTRNIQGLANASPRDIAEVEVTPLGNALHWERLDVDFSVPGLFAGILGTRVWMAELGRKGGSSSSEAKASAARENGRKGGRPAKGKGQRPAKVKEVINEPIEARLLEPLGVVFAHDYVQLVQNTVLLTTAQVVNSFDQYTEANCWGLHGGEELAPVEGLPVNRPNLLVPVEALVVEQMSIGNIFRVHATGAQAAANSNELALAA